MGYPEVMKAAQVKEHGKPMVMCTDVAVPKLGTHEVLVKIDYSGVCHTDVHVIDGDWAVKSPLPMTPGHEGCGHVTHIGSSVKKVKVGDRVGIPWLHDACQACTNCVEGWETVCSKQRNTGFTAHGGFGEYVVGQEDFVTHIPKDLDSIQAAPVLCAGVTVYKGLKVSSVRPGQFMVIVGAGGGLGHLAVQYGAAMGMRVIGVDEGSKKDMLMKLGCEHAIDFKTENVTEMVMKYTGGVGSHGALILATNKRPFAEASTYVRARGTIVCIALPPGDFPLDIFTVVLKALIVRGSIVGTRQDMEEALDFAARGKVKCEIEVKPYSEVNSVIDKLRTGQILGRVVLDMTK